jgi:hypothetical protein
MRKYIAAATLILAAGSALAVNVAKEAASASSAEEKASPLQKFCATYWGAMSDDQTYCRFEQTYHLNLSQVGDSLVMSYVPVIAGDTVSVQATEEAMAVVGMKEYGARSFVSTTEGYLSFRALSGQGYFTVRQVALRRCFAQANGAIETLVCPGAR